MEGRLYGWDDLDTATMWYFIWFGLRPKIKHDEHDIT